MPRHQRGFWETGGHEHLDEYLHHVRVNVVASDLMQDGRNDSDALQCEPNRAVRIRQPVVTNFADDRTRFMRWSTTGPS